MICLLILLETCCILEIRSRIVIEPIERGKKMQKNSLKKGLSVSVIASMLLILAACGGTAKTEVSPTVAPGAANEASPAATAATGAPVTLKFFSNLPDRK